MEIHIGIVENRSTDAYKKTLPVNKILPSYTIYTASDFQSACIHTIDLLESCQEGWFQSVTHILYQIRDHTKDEDQWQTSMVMKLWFARSDRGHEPEMFDGLSIDLQPVPQAHGFHRDQLKGVIDEVPQTDLH